MCLAVPGKREASTALMDCEIGDWVIVSAKFVMRKVPEEEAKKVLEVWDETDKC